MKKKNLKVLLSILLTAALVAGAFCISALFRNQIPKPVTGKLNVYFIDVGQADSVFLTCNGESMLIDGGNAEDAPTVTAFIKNLGIDTLDYVVATHAHEDHAGGLGGIIPEFTVKKVLSPVKEYNSACFRNFVKSANEQCGITLCSAGERWTLGNAEIYSLWPLDAEDEETNNTSIVLKAVFGAVSYLFCGDLESDAEARLIETGADLSANVLKAGHHGSDTSSSYYFLRSVMPQFAIISCGKDNSYGHPHKSTLEKFEQADITYYRTDELGTISSSTDGNKITFTFGGETVTAAAQERTPALGESDTQYIGNRSSKKYHLPSCPSLPKEENRKYFNSKKEAEDAGYSPCGSCIKN